MIGVFADALAAVAVAAVVAGWALGQWPTILPGLDIREAAAPHDTLVAVVVAVLGGGAIVFPSLALLFRLTLAGQLDAGAPRATEPQPEGRRRAHDRSALLARTAVACLRRRVSARNSSAACLNTDSTRG
jgi:cytochrome bd ubiquinol oxidase subunit II